MYNKLNNTVKDIFNCIHRNYSAIESPNELNEVTRLLCIAMDISYWKNAITKDYVVEETYEDEVYIFDTSRLMFWKPNSKGYTSCFQDAGLYSVKKAKEICKDSSDNKIVLIG